MCRYSKKLNDIRLICLDNKIDFVAGLQNGLIVFNLPQGTHGLSYMLGNMHGLMAKLQSFNVGNN